MGFQLVGTLYETADYFKDPLQTFPALSTPFPGSHDCRLVFLISSCNIFILVLVVFGDVNRCLSGCRYV